MNQYHILNIFGQCNNLIPIVSFDRRLVISFSNVYFYCVKWINHFFVFVIYHSFFLLIAGKMLSFWQILRPHSMRFIVGLFSFHFERIHQEQLLKSLGTKLLNGILQLSALCGVCVCVGGICVLELQFIILLVAISTVTTALRNDNNVFIRYKHLLWMLISISVEWAWVLMHCHWQNLF